MKRKLLIFIVLICVIGTLYLVLLDYLSLEDLIAEERRLRDALARRPMVGILVGFVIYLGFSMVPFTSGKAIVVGWLYGFWSALLIVNIGLTIAAMVSFWFSRHVFSDAVKSRFGRSLARVNRGLRSEGAYYVFAARVLHVPFTPTNYVLGVTRIRARSFWWSTQLGLLPGNILFVFAGHQLPSLRELADEGIGGVLSPGVMAALLALSVAPLLLQVVVRRLIAWRRPQGAPTA